MEPDMTEAIRLIGELRDEFNIPLINITMGNPYKNPHVNRPYDKGNYVPPEHPFEGLARMMDCVGAAQKNNPELVVLGSGFSYLRQFAPYQAAGAVEEGICTLTGFGREAFAYPDFIQDLKKNGQLDSRKCCVSCGACVEQCPQQIEIFQKLAQIHKRLG